METASKAPEGAVGGAIVLGALFAAYAALISAGQLGDPGFALQGMGLIPAVLAGFGLGSLCGLFVGGLLGSTFAEYEASLHTVDSKRGGLMLGVYCHPQRVNEAKKLLEAAHGKNITVNDAQAKPLHYAIVAHNIPTTDTLLNPAPDSPKVLSQGNDQPNAGSC